MPNENRSSSLAMKAFNEIPTPDANAQRITALRKNRGRVTGYQLSGGRVIDKAEAVELAKQGGIAGVGISNRRGNEYLKSLPDENENTNLSNLPSIS